MVLPETVRMLGLELGLSEDGSLAGLTLSLPPLSWVVCPLCPETPPTVMLCVQCRQHTAIVSGHRDGCLDGCSVSYAKRCV